MSIRLQCYGSYCFPKTILNSYLHTFKTGFHLVVWLMMRIMKFPLKRLMKKTHRMQLAAPLFTSCNILIYYHITLAALFIYLIMHTPYILNCKIDWESEDGDVMDKLCYNLNCCPSDLSVSSLYLHEPFQYICIRLSVLPENQNCLRMTLDRAVYTVHPALGLLFLL